MALPLNFGVEKAGHEVIATATPLTLDAHASRAWVRRFARTTPGLVVAIAVVVAASCILAGIVSAAALNGRIAEQKAVLDRSEPFAYAAQNLYAASSAADAAAATAFLSGGSQTPLMRARYQQALAAAASSLADATAGAPDPETRKALAQVSANLATYAGLVEAARANNVQGFPIGSAYLREASASMQTNVLPGAEKIYSADLARVDQAQQRVGSLPKLGLALLALALAAIVIGSVIMFRRTNRTSISGCSQLGSSCCWSSAASSAASAWPRPTSSEAGSRAPRGSDSSRTPASLPSKPAPKRPCNSSPAAISPPARSPSTDTSTISSPALAPVHRSPARPSRLGGRPPHAGRRLSRRRLPGSGRPGARHRPGHRARNSPSSNRAFATRSTVPRPMRRHVADAGRYLAWTPTATLVLMAWPRPPRWSGCGHGCGSSYEDTRSR